LEASPNGSRVEPKLRRKEVALRETSPKT